MRIGTILLASLALVIGGCGQKEPQTAAPSAAAQGNGAASDATRDANAAVARELPLAEQQDFEDAKRGLIGGGDDVVIDGAGGRRIWDTASFGFIQGDAPPSVN